MSWSHAFIDTTGKSFYAKPVPIKTGTWEGDAESASEVGSTGIYEFADLVDGIAYIVFEQSGGTPASSDTAQVVVQPPANSGLGFYDSFTDTAASALTDHTPELDPSGYAWRSLGGGAMVFDTDGQSIKLSSNVFGEPGGLFVTNANSKNYTARLRFKTESPQAAFFHIRVNPDDESHYSVKVLLGEIRISYYSGSTRTDVATLEFDSGDDLAEDTYYWLRVLVDGSTVQAMVEGRRSTRIQYEMDVNLNETFVGVGGFDEESVYSAVEVYPASGGGASNTEAIDDLQITLENVVDNAAAAIASSGSVYRAHLGLDDANLSSSISAFQTAGTGARQVTVTVDDDSDNLLSGVQVNVYSSGGTPLNVFGVTDANGQVSFNLDDGDYQLAATDVAGYGSHAPQAFTVSSGSTSSSIELTADAAPVAAPGKCTVAVTCLDESSNPKVGVSLIAVISQIPSGSIGQAYSQRGVRATSNGSGIAYLELTRGAKYLLRRGDFSRWFEIDVPDATSGSVDSIIGI